MRKAKTPTSLASDATLHPWPERAAILQLIDGYSPSSGDESRFKATIVDFLSSSANPFNSKSYSHGHVTASGVVIDMLSRRTLLIYHPRLSIWLQPGGHVEPQDHTIIDTVVRELREETGLQLPRENARIFDLDIHDIAASGKEPTHTHYDIRFLFKCSEANALAVSPETAARWVSIHEAMQTASNPGLRRLFIKCNSEIGQ